MLKLNPSAELWCFFEGSEIFAAWYAFLSSSIPVDAVNLKARLHKVGEVGENTGPCILPCIQSEGPSAHDAAFLAVV
jgi:hypothetical protein